MAKNRASDWLPRVLFESFLITISILVALALDEWRENRQHAEAIQQALSNFASEIQRNKARVEDTAPFNRGLLEVLRNRYETKDIGSVDDYVNMVESYAPADLRTTAWETALATGSLAEMQYDLVSVLSFTYGKQEDYQIATQSGMADLTSLQNLADDRLELATYNAVRYLNGIRGMESELNDIYSEALTVVENALSGVDDSPD
jgi:hypothetical protein